MSNSILFFRCHFVSPFGRMLVCNNNHLPTLYLFESPVYFRFSMVLLTLSSLSERHRLFPNVTVCFDASSVLNRDVIGYFGAFFTFKFDVIGCFGGFSLTNVFPHFFLSVSLFLYYLHYLFHFCIKLTFKYHRVMMCTRYSL